MGTKYASQAAVGYDASPPPDDGTQVASNKITWAGITSKLSDVLKTYADAINTQLVAFTNFSGSSLAGAYTTVAADHMQTLEATGTFTVSLLDANTAGSGYVVTVKNVGTGVITVGPNTATDTLDGTANATLDIPPQGARTFKSVVGANGYSTQDGVTSATPTGMVHSYIGTTAPAGFVMGSGRTIGSATSGATERANIDTLPLYTLLWNSWANAQAPVTGGRGASAAADFSSNKPIKLPDLRGKAIFGIDNMGGSAANIVTSGVSGIAGTTLGATGGSQSLTSHTHTINDSGHTHQEQVYTAGAGAGVVSSATTALPTTPTATGAPSTQSSTTGITNQATGAGASQNMPPTMMMNVIIKL